MTARSDRSRVFAPGADGAWLAGIEELLGAEAARDWPDSVSAGDIVLLDAVGAGLAAVSPLGNAFSACRAIKADTGVLVYVVLRDDDAFGAEIARFCLANGSIRVSSTGELVDASVLERGVSSSPRRVSVDALLDRLETELRGDEGRRRSGIQRMLGDEPDHALLSQITDRETGLFDGHFASFKLDEEFKRASRFHQPLSLILIDCAGPDWPEGADQRATLLAEAASVFLNECRDIDVLARFTESVFLFLLPGTGLDGASTVARRMLKGLRERAYSVPIELDPAAGLATVPMAGIADRRAFLARAEACLEVARNATGAARLCAGATVADSE